MWDQIIIRPFSQEGLTAPMVATNRGHLDTLNALIKEGVAVDQPHKTSGSMVICYKSNSVEYSWK